MALYDISSTAFLPDGNCVAGTTVVELSNKHIAMLESAIEACGTIDVAELDLEHEMPHIYDILYNACQQATTVAVEAYYLRTFYYEDRLGYNIDDAMQRCWDAGLFQFDAGLDNDLYDDDPDMALMMRQENNRIYFENWLSNYIDSLDDTELIDFMANFMDSFMTELGEWEFTIEVPDCFKE